MYLPDNYNFLIGLAAVQSKTVTRRALVFNILIIVIYFFYHRIDDVGTPHNLDNTIVYTWY